MKKSAQQYFSSREDSREKSAYLQAQYAEIKPLAFYDAVMGKADADFPLCVALSDAAEGHHLAKYADADEMLEASFTRSDAFLYPATYFHAYPKQKLLHELRCLYIDLDKINAKSLRRLCEQDFYGYRPTYLVNSGNGVHLVYVLTQELAAYNWAKALLREMHSALLRAFRKHRFAADLGTGLSHAYRIVGSLTKLGQTCRAYRVGGRVAIESLAESLGIKWQRPASTPAPKKKIDKATRKSCPARRGFYDYLVRKIEERTQEGHRYTSLFALVCVGHKCRRALESIREDVLRLAERLGLPKREAEHAVAACNPEKAQTVCAATLEGWLGWSFDRKTKRNGRTREEHLAAIAKSRTDASRCRVTGYLKANPMATISEIARTLAMGRKTVAKYFHEWLTALRNKAIEQMKSMRSAVQAADSTDTADAKAVDTAPPATIDTPADTPRAEGPGRRAFLAFLACHESLIASIPALRASSAPRSAQEEEADKEKADFSGQASPCEEAGLCSLQPV